MGHRQENILDQIRNTTKKRFADEQRLFSFEDFVEQVGSEPKRFLRNTIDWVCDAFK